MRETQTFSVELPNGMVIEDIPIGTTKEQIKQKLMTKGIDPDAQPAAEKGFIDNVGEDLSKRSSNIAGLAKGLAYGERSLPEFAGKTVGQVAGGINDIAGNVVSAVTPDFVKEGIKSGISAFAKTAPGQAVGAGIEKASQLAAENPRTAEWLSAFGNVAALPAVSVGSKVAADAAGRPLQGTGKALTKMGEEGQLAARKKFVADLVIEPESKNVLEARVGRSTPQGLLRKKEYELLPDEQEAAELVAKTAVSPKKTYEENFSILEQVNKTEANKLRSELERVDLRYDGAELKGLLAERANELMADIAIVQAKPVAETILNKAAQLLDSNPKTLSGALTARQQLDSWITAQGKQRAFDPSSENAVSATLRATRQTINDFIEKKATPPSMEQYAATVEKFNKATDDWGKLHELKNNLMKSIEQRTAAAAKGGQQIVGGVSGQKYASMAAKVSDHINDLEGLLAVEKDLIGSIKEKAKLAGQQRGMWRRKSITEAATEARKLDNIKKQVESKKKLIAATESKMMQAIERGKKVKPSQHLLEAAEDADSIAMLNKEIEKQYSIFRDAEKEIANYAPRNVDVKDSLRKQHLVYNAMDNIRPKAAKEAKSAPGRMAQKLYQGMPVNSDVGKLAATALLAGGGGTAALLSPALALGALGAYGTYKAAKSPALKQGVGKALTKTGDYLRRGAK